MEKHARERLLDAGADLLGHHGARQASARSTEDAAGLPHGSMRHHFGSQDAFLIALTESLLARVGPRPGESVQQLATRWLTDDRTATRARYELTLLGVRSPRIGALIRSARDDLERWAAGDGARTDGARTLVGALDGIVLDALVRGDPDRNVAPLPAALSAASNAGR